MSISGKFQKLKNARRLDSSKSLFRIIYEYLLHKLTKPELAEQYFNKYLFRQSLSEQKDYIVTKMLADKIWYYNDMKLNSMLTNKLYTELFFSSFKIPVVRNFLYNQNYLFFDEQRPILINNPSEFCNLILQQREKGLWVEESMIIKKKDDSFGGRNIFKVSYNGFKESKALQESVFNNVINSGYLFQNCMVQHPELDKITPSSLNTLRLDTFCNNMGEAKLFNATFRFSTKDTFVDNVSSGGMYCGIDLNSGMLQEEAFSSFDLGSAAVLNAHPITGQIFKGFSIPFFEQAKQLVLDAARLIPNARVIGWDVGILIDGPIIIEGNYGNNIYNFELSQNGFRNNPVFQELLGELELFYSLKDNDLKVLKKKYDLFH